MIEQKAEPPNADRARQEINRLVSEIERLADLEMPPQEFYVELLRRIHQASAADASAIWLRSGARWQATAHVQLTVTGVAAEENRAAHVELLNAVCGHTGPGVFGARATGVEPGLAKVANPTDLLLVFAPIIVDEQAVGVVELFVPPARAGAVQAFVRLAAKAAYECVRYVKNYRFRQVAGQEKTWNELDTFIRSVHAGLNVKQVAFLAANDGRRLIGAERVSVAIRRGDRCQITAISGQDSVEKRANLVRLMSLLAKTAIDRSEMIVYNGAADPDWSKPVARALGRYVEESNSRLVLVVPLVDPKLKAIAKGRAKKPRAALIVEMIGDEADPDQLAGKAEVVARHASLALYNAFEVENIFLLPVWKLLGKTSGLFSRSKLPIIMALAAATTAIGLTLAFLPWPLRMEGQGELTPLLRRTVFAPVAGVVEQVKVDYLSEVRANAELIVMSNPQLADEMLRLEGELKSKALRWKALNASLAQERGRSQADQQDAQRAAAELDTEMHSIRNQIQLAHAQMEKLRLRAAIDGEILTWKPVERLLKRPVERGEALLEVAETTGPWIVEVKFPEKAVAHLQRARANAVNGELHTAFMISSATEVSHTGVLYELATQASPDGGENVCFAKIRLDRQVPVHLRLAGAQVRVRVDCGDHALGYVLFRELIDFARERLFY